MHLAEYARALWQFSRPRTLVLIWLHILIAYVCLASKVPAIWQILLVLVASTSSYISAVSFNDLSDREVDSINLSKDQLSADRPLINGTVSQVSAWYIAVISSVICVIACGLLQLWLFVVACVMILLNVCYSMPPIRIAKRGALAQYLLPIMYVLFPATLALAIASTLTVTFLWVVSGLYIIFVARLFLKDLRDEKGDRATGKRTYLVRHGLKNTLVHAWVCLVIGIGLSAIQLIGVNIDALLLGGIAILCGIGITWALYFCYKAAPLDSKLLWVAVVGRFASMWAFCLVVYLMLGYSAIPYAQRAWLLVFTAAIFFAGIGMLYEELQSVMRKQSRLQKQ